MWWLNHLSGHRVQDQVRVSRPHPVICSLLHHSGTVICCIIALNKNPFG
jgi:hypothetical protein